MNTLTAASRPAALSPKVLRERTIVPARLERRLDPVPARMALRHGLLGLRIAIVDSDEVRGSTDLAALDVHEADASITAISPDALLAADANLGAAPLAGTLVQGAGMGVAGPTLAVAPLVHHFGWAWDNPGVGRPRSACVLDRRGVIRSALAFVIASASATAQSATAQSAVTQSAAAQSANEPLGIALEGWPYPFPVRWREFDLDGQTVRQAYMDLPPTAAPNGRTALLLHGRNFPASYWEGVMRALAAAGWRVIATDQIGFGRSSKPDLAYTFDMFARNTAALLDGLGLAQVDLIGHSLGGMLAVRFTRTYPARVRRLVLESPVGLEDYRFTVPPVTDRFLYDREYALSADAYRSFLRDTYSLSLPPEAVEPFVVLRERLKGSGEYPRWVKSFVQTYQMIHDQPVVHEYPLVRTRTLFIMGSADHNAPGKPYTPPELAAGMGQNADNAARIAATMPDARVLVLDGVGHMPHLERPEQFDAALLDFLGQD